MSPRCAHPGADACTLGHAWFEEARIRGWMHASLTNHGPRMRSSGGADARIFGQSCPPYALFQPLMA
eukprot:12406129-Karenia_brevis.AAC.2